MKLTIFGKDNTG